MMPSIFLNGKGNSEKEMISLPILNFRRTGP